MPERNVETRILVVVGYCGRDHLDGRGSGAGLHPVLNVARDILGPGDETVPLVGVAGTTTLGFWLCFPWVPCYCQDAGPIVEYHSVDRHFPPVEDSAHGTGPSAFVEDNLPRCNIFERNPAIRCGDWSVFFQRCATSGTLNSKSEEASALIVQGILSAPAVTIVGLLSRHIHFSLVAVL